MIILKTIEAEKKIITVVCGAVQLWPACGAVQLWPACGAVQLWPACGAVQLWPACGAVQLWSSYSIFWSMQQLITSEATLTYPALTFPKWSENMTTESTDKSLVAFDYFASYDF